MAGAVWSLRLFEDIKNLLRIYIEQNSKILYTGGSEWDPFNCV